MSMLRALVETIHLFTYPTLRNQQTFSTAVSSSCGRVVDVRLV